MSWESNIIKFTLTFSCSTTDTTDTFRKILRTGFQFCREFLHSSHRANAGPLLVKRPANGPVDATDDSGNPTGDVDLWTSISSPSRQKFESTVPRS